MQAKFQPLFNHARRPLHSLLPLDTPMAVFLVASQACNIRCTYCPHSLPDVQLRARGVTMRNMEWGVFVRAVEQLKAFPQRIKSLNFSGLGEPMLNPRLADMIRHVKEEGIAEDVNFISNGILFQKGRTEAVIDAGVDRIFISVQGMSGMKYKEVCGKEIDFDAYIQNLKYLYEYKQEVNSKTKINIKIADIALEDGDRDRFLQSFGAICDTIHIETIKPLYGDVDYTGLLGQKAGEMTRTRFGRECHRQKACYLAFYDLNVTPDGEIRPCGVPEQAIPGLGNINDTTLVAAWNSGVRREFLLSMLRGERSAHPVCGGCEFPDDVPSPDDEIDPWAEDLISKFSKEI